MDIFNEDEEFIAYRFSSILLFIFIYYSLSYYFILADPIQKPHISIAMIMIILHISHIILLKFLHGRGDYMYTWIAAILPLILYLLYSKYKGYMQRKADKKKKEMYAEFKKQQGNDGGINATPQHPNAHPMRSQEYVGLKSNNQVQNQPQQLQPIRSVLPTTMPNPVQIAQQSQMNDMFSNSRSMSNMQQDIQYDPNSVSGMRTNNTVTEQIQPMQQLDSMIGMNAGNDMLGFDPYSSSLASF